MAPPETAGQRCPISKALIQGERCDDRHSYALFVIILADVVIVLPSAVRKSERLRRKS